MVIMDTVDYLKEGFTQLTGIRFYRKQDFDITPLHVVHVNRLIHSLYIAGLIDKKTRGHFWAKSCQTAQFLPATQDS